MATIPSSSTRSVDSRASQRVSTETKAAPKTTEFALTVVAIVGILVAALLISDGDAPGDVDQFIARQAWLYVAIVVAAYSISRGLAKSGSSEESSNGSRRD